MGVEKAFADVVGIVVVIGVFVVAAVIARPHQDGIFERGRSEQEDHQAEGPFRLKSFVSEKAVIAGGNTEAGEHEHDKEHAEMEPVETKEPEIDGQRGYGKQGGSDQE
jgi:hypothetical protein